MKLYVIGTPIGNMGDFSQRAKETLESCDFVAAEDTRVSAKLCPNKKMISYYDRQKGRDKVAKKIIEKIKQGESCALVTDAGMPAVSDPGQELVSLAIQNNISVECIPGPTAFVTALVLSGLDTTEFSFIGFLPSKGADRKKKLEKLKNEPRTLIFYEAPHRIKEMLIDISLIFGIDRKASLSRELTKLHEETLHMTLGELARYYESNEPRGEYVLVVDKASIKDKEYSLEEAINMAKELIANGEKPTDACKISSKETGFPKSEIYRKVISNA